nr:hypothetical protein [Sphingobium soli]
MIMRFSSMPQGLAGAALMLLASGCSGGADPDSANGSNQAAAPVSTIENVAEPDAVGAAPAPTDRMATDDWVGRWTGPEGLFLDIQPSPDGKPGHYAIANKDTLDRQGNYDGVADGAMIRFERDGKDLTIRPGTGAETGFKWLAEKENCLIVVAGQEGYCR